jgi:multiple sugar transport system permease protein
MEQQMAEQVLPLPGKQSLSRSPAGGGRARRRLAPNLRHHLAGYGFMIGAVLCFALFSWYPMIREVIMSFQGTHRNPVTRLPTTTWVGFRNYTRIWHDPTFTAAWKNTVEFSLLALLIGFAVPFVVAIGLNELRHARGYLRVLVYLPVMLPPASALLLFQYFYDPNTGLFDHILHVLHLPTSQFVQSSSSALVSVVIASTWMNMGGTTLIYLAALQNIPGELYEAAELDGAGILGRIRHVTIPQTKLILSMMLMLQIVGTMQLFIEPFILTNGGAGPDNSTISVVNLIYQYAFNLSGSSNYNSASALGVLLMLVLGVFSALYLWISRDRDK